MVFHNTSLVASDGSKFVVIIDDQNESSNMRLSREAVVSRLRSGKYYARYYPLAAEGNTCSSRFSYTESRSSGSHSKCGYLYSRFDKNGDRSARKCDKLSHVASMGFTSAASWALTGSCVFLVDDSSGHKTMTQPLEGSRTLCPWLETERRIASPSSTNEHTSESETANLGARWDMGEPTLILSDRWPVHR